MAIAFSQLLSLGATTTVVGGIAGGGVIAYQNRAAIFKAFTRDTPAARPQVNNVKKGQVDEESENHEENEELSQQQSAENTHKTSPEQQDKTTPNPDEEEKDVSGSGSSVLDATEFTYIIAKFTKNTANNSSKTLFQSDGSTQNYVCFYEKNTNDSIKNTNCKIFKLSSQVSNKELVDLSTNTVNNEVKNYSELTTDTNFLIKLSSSFYNQFLTSKQTFSIQEATGDQPYSFGDFSELIEVKKGEQTLTPETVKSNLFTALITKPATGLTGTIDYVNDTYTCKIGEETTACKFYKLASANTTYTKTDLDGVTKITDQSSELVANQYILVELTGVSKTTSQLQGKFEITKTATQNQVILTGVAEQLVIGKLDVSTSKSNLFVPKDAFGTLTDGTISSSTDAYILTKTTEVLDYLQNSTYSDGNYICRVTNATHKFDDENCKVFPFPLNPAAQHFDINDFDDDSKKINAYSQLAPNTHQVIKLKKELQDEWNKGSSTLSLIRKDRKEKPINNKVFTFSKEYEFTDTLSTKSALKSNLFLARFKDGKPGTAVTLGESDTLTCEIGSSTDAQACKVFKFNPGSRINAITAEAFTKAIRVSSTNNLTTNYYYIFELSNTKKNLDDLKNKKITLKSGTTVLGNFEFDSLLFGKHNVGALQTQRKEVSYLVKKSSNNAFTTSETLSSYGCKWSAPTPSADSTQIDNYDYDCKLTQLAASASETIIPYKDIKSSSDKIDAETLKTNNDTYFKLTFDENLLYNFPTEWTQDQEITIELVATSKKILHKVKIVQKIDDTNSLKGNASYALASVGIAADSGVQVTEATATKCSYEDLSASDDSKLFDCSLYTTTDSNNTALTSITADTKVKPSFTAVTANTPLTTSNYYVVKLDGKKPYSELTTTPIIYYFYEETISDVDSPTKTHKKVTLTINGFIDGQYEANKNLFFVKDPTTISA